MSYYLTLYVRRTHRDAALELLRQECDEADAPLPEDDRPCAAVLTAHDLHSIGWVFDALEERSIPYVAQVEDAGAEFPLAAELTLWHAEMECGDRVELVGNPDIPPAPMVTWRESGPDQDDVHNAKLLLQTLQLLAR